jgi:hypothetical protein
LCVLILASLVVAAPAGAAAPLAQFSWAPYSPVTGQTVAFDAVGSNCGAATPCTYAWEDDGSDGSGGTQWPLGKGQQLKFTFQEASTKRVRLKLYDSAGVLRAQTYHNVVVRAAAPVAPSDTTPPDTTITSGPAASTSSTGATFAFSSTEAGSTFQCRVDAAAYAPCSSPKSYTGLAVGSHSFSVRATDAAGNTDASPAVRAWTVTTVAPTDTTAPDTTIDTGPADGTSTTATFTFHASETSTFRCTMSGATASSCSSPASYTGMSVGSHTLTVAATDTAGNADATPATKSWTVDVQPPPTSGACDQTVSGSAVVSAAASAPSGSTVCVTGGSYGAVAFSAARSGYVTIKPATSTAVTFSDLDTTGSASYYRFQGLHVAGMVDIGGRNSSNGNHIDLTRSYLTGISVWTGMTDVLIDHNDIENGGNQLESIGGTRVTVNGNRFANAGGDAMYITTGWNNWTITNNEITGVMENGDHSDCLQSYAGGSGMVFSGNYEHDNLCQGFFIKDGAASNVTMDNNLFIKGLGTGDTTNLYQISNFQVHNNTIADGKGFMLRGGGGPATIDHNVIDSFATTDTPWTGVTEGNDWFGQVSAFSPSSTTQVGGTPPFANTAALDYRLTDGSGRGVDWTPAQKHFGP